MSDNIYTEALISEKQNQFDELYSAACKEVRDSLVIHFFDTNNWTNKQIEEITGKLIYDRESLENFGQIQTAEYTNDEGDFDWKAFEKNEGYISLETFDSEYLDDLLMTDSDFDLQTMIKFAEDFGIDLTGLEVPYKIIVFHNNDLKNYSEVDKMLRDETNIPACMIDKYIVCYNKEDLMQKWKDNLKESEGSWYGIKDGEGILVGGVYDPNDIEDIEALPSYTDKPQGNHKDVKKDRLEQNR